MHPNIKYSAINRCRLNCKRKYHEFNKNLCVQYSFMTKEILVEKTADSLFEEKIT